MAIGYLDYLTNNGVIYFPYVRVEGIINADGKPFSQWMTQVNTHNHDIRYAASAHQHNNHLKNIGPNNVRTTASYPDPFNIIADSGGTAEIKLYASVTKDDVGRIRYKNSKVSIGINDDTWLDLQDDGVYFNEEKLVTETYVQEQLDAAAKDALNLDTLDQRYAANRHAHEVEEITDFPRTLPNPKPLTINITKSDDTSVSIEYSGIEEKSIDISLFDLGLDTSINYDEKYYSIGETGLVFNTSIQIARESSLGFPDSSLNIDIKSDEPLYAYNVGLTDDEESSVGDAIAMQMTTIDKDSRLSVTTTRFVSMRDSDNQNKLCIFVPGQYEDHMSENSRPIMLLNGGNPQTLEDQNVVIHGNLAVQGGIFVRSSITRDFEVILINLIKDNWIESGGVYTQTIDRPKSLYSEYPILVKHIPNDTSLEYQMVYAHMYRIINNGYGIVEASSIIFRIYEAPTTDIAIGLVNS